MSKNSKDIVLTSALRTSVGKFGGIHKKLQAHELGSIIIKGILKKTNVDPLEIDEVILGQVLPSLGGQNPARQALIKSGIPKDKTAFNINQVCGSGLRAIVLGYQSIGMGSSKFVIAGGQESMSNSDEKEMLTNGLIDAFNNYHMGVTAENVSQKYGISRKEQDEFALNSQNKAKNAITKKLFKNELIKIADEKNKIILEIDEHPRINLNIQDLNKLKTVFKENGTVTPGNSSGINDGAAGVVLTTKKIAETKNLEILGKITSWSSVGVEPSLMGLGPIDAIKLAVKKAKWNIHEVDLFEINEAFAAQSIAVINELNLDYEKINVNGGAIALGHPIGASGARIVVTLLHEMKRRKVKKGCAALCIGGGMGIAMCLERI